jgi:threonine dehydrogenase-like Zn-dependent dehydrogenase
MRALCWEAPTKVGVHDVPDPKILSPRDAIVKVSSTAICGSDLHLYDGYIPAMVPGDIMGHEFMGEVVEVGSGVGNLSAGDRVVVPFPIACGSCGACKRELYSLCENSNPNAAFAEKVMGHSPCGIFGYSHLTGGYAGGQAEYVRVPFADVGPLKVDDDLTDEQVLFLSDIIPTGYMGADMCDIEQGDVVAVWGAGPVGLFAVASAYLLGASKVIAIDRFPERLRKAESQGAHAVNYEETSVLEAKQLGRLQTDRGQALREAILSCANGGTVSIIGVYGGFMDKFPTGSLMNRSLTVRTGQAHVHRYLPRLLEHIRNGDIDPTFVISHRMSLEEAPQAYKMFRSKRDECTKVVLTP